MTVIANYFYYCGKLFLKLLIFRLIITYFEHAECARLRYFNIKFSGERAPGPPSTNLNQHQLQGYLRAWYVIYDVKKENIQFLYISLTSGGFCLVKWE